MKYLCEETTDDERPLLETIEDMAKVVGWKDQNNMFPGEIEEELHGKSTTIKIVNQGVLSGDVSLSEGDEFIVLKDREQEWMSLLLAMILNVKEKGRGKENGEGKFLVYLSKSANGLLHIVSETDCEDSALKGVRGCLEQEPFSEESGITLWTLNSYLKKVKSAWAKLILEKMRNDNIDRIAELPVLSQQYLKLLENVGVI